MNWKKRLLSLMMIGSLVLGLAVPYTAYAASGWKKIYHSFLKKHSLDFSEVGYAKLDKDNTPELVTDSGNVYTIKKGKLKKFKNSKSLYEDITYCNYWRKGNCFYYRDGDAEGGSDTNYYSIQKGKVKKIKSFKYTGNIAVYREYWMVDGKEVTKEEYTKQFNHFNQKYNKKYGKPKKINYKDYTRYHYYYKKPFTYDTDSKMAKVTVKGNTLKVVGKVESTNRPIYGKKHIFKLSSKTKYYGGDVRTSKKKFRKWLKDERRIKDFEFGLYVNTKKGKVVSAVIHEIS